MHCKNPDCGSNRVRGPEKSRFSCLECGGIYVSEDIPLRSLKLSVLAPKSVRRWYASVPECFGNFDSNCTICTQDCRAQGVRLSCRRVSPPPTRATSPATHRPSEEEEAIVCSVCGELDRGTFCSNCGSPIAAEDGAATPVRDAVEARTAEWGRYFRTLRRLVVEPVVFFSGAFSAGAKRFHHDTATLDSVQFLVKHLAFTGVLVLLGNLVVYGAQSALLEPLVRLEVVWGGVVDLVLYTALLYVPAVVVAVPLKLFSSQSQRVRRASISMDPDVSVANAWRACCYMVGMEIFVIPLLVFARADSGEGSYSQVLFLAAMLVWVGVKLLSHLVVFPTALMFSCGVPRQAAEFASGLSLAVILGGCGVDDRGWRGCLSEDRPARDDRRSRREDSAEVGREHSGRSMPS